MDFGTLVTSVEKLDQVFTENTVKAINRNLTARNWLTGFYIVNYEQNGSDRAKYGDKTLQKMSERLQSKSMSVRNLQLYRQFFIEFPRLVQPIYDFVLTEFRSEESLVSDINDCISEIKNCATTGCVIPQSVIAQSGNQRLPNLATSGCQIVQPAVAQLDDDLQMPPEVLFKNLSFSHFALILPIKDPLARVFYELETIKGTWTKRELKRQIDTNYYQRSGISRNPQKMSQLVQSKAKKADLHDIIKSPFVYEFLGLSDKEVVDEAELEEAIIQHLEEFMMELGTGFCFEARQKRILIDDEYDYCDLVFYHRILKCHVLIDLKAEKLKYSDVAQMNMYLSYYKHNMMQPDDNPPVGILMCTEAGKELVKYATDGIDENLLIQKYRISLPSESVLTDWLKKEVAKFAGK